MTGDEFRAIRQELGLSARDFGRALGYQGNPNTLSVQIREYENEKRPIPPWIERLATMFYHYGIPRAWLTQSGIKRH